MLIEKKKIRQIIKDHELTCIKGRDEDELVNIFYESLSEFASFQEERLETKEDIKNGDSINEQAVLGFREEV